MGMAEGYALGFCFSPESDFNKKKYYYQVYSDVPVNWVAFEMRPRGDGWWY